MKVIVYWANEDSTKLFNIVKESLEDLWLGEFIPLETSNEESLKEELSITKEPAFIIEEESIEFKDMIFEWIIPEKEEISSMFMSIIGWWQEEWWSCSTDSCGSCSCHC